MKQGKQLMYVLLALFIAVWVLVIYRVVVAVGGDDTTTTVAASILKDTIASTKQNWSYSLNANYRDPFLGTFPIVRKERVKSIIKPAPPLPPITVIDWSFISFMGLINNRQTNKKVALVRINGQETTVVEGTVVNGIAFLQFAMDSIKIRYQEQISTIYK